MSEWKEYKLGDLIETNAKSIGRDYPYSKILYLDTGSITCNSIDSYQEFELDIAPSRAKRLVKQDDIIYSSVRPNQLHYGYITNPQENLVVSTGFVTITCNKELLCPKFLYYYLIQSQITEYLHSVAEASTSAYPSLKPSDIEALDIEIPSLDIQHSIASILSSLDDEIDLLHCENATLEKLAETLFRQWFVEEAKEEWEEGKLGDYFDVKTGKKDANFSVENGSFPFFTCSKQTLFAPSYSFEGSAILLAGNGDFNVKRYVGKFEAYQRTYVLIPYNEKYFNFLYIFIKYYLDELTGGHRGSVISFITKGMITDFPVFLPEKNIDNKLSVFDVIYKKVDANTAQIQTLIQTRDGLLPRLMSGEIKV